MPRRRSAPPDSSIDPAATRLAEAGSLQQALAGVQAQIALAAARRQEAERRAALAERQAREAAARAQAAATLFEREVGAVHRLRPHGRALLKPPAPPPEPRMRERDEREVMREALSDDVDAASLLLTDDGLSFRRPGLPPDVAERLRRGHWALQDQIDLHGHTRDEAREALAQFLRRARQRGLRCVRVVHGKGHGSPGREPVLKGRVQRWLAQWDSVIAFAQASGPDGGAGALIVLLDRG